MQTSFVRLMLFGWLLVANDRCTLAPSPMSKLLVAFAEQVHREANAPVLVKTAPDASCSNEVISEFASTPQVRWNERIDVTLLRYSDDNVCIDTYVASASGPISLNPKSYQLVLGSVPASTRFTSDKRLAFRIRNSSDWGKLLLSVPRVANLKTVESLTRHEGNLHAAAKHFREQAAIVLGDSGADSPSRPEKLIHADDPISSRLPIVVYVTSLILVLAGVAVGLYWVKKRNAKRQPARVPQACSKLPIDFEQAPVQDEASFAEAISTLTNADVSDAYIEVVTKSARVLFEKLERDRDPGSMRKVRQYLDERIADWRANHPERR